MNAGLQWLIEPLLDARGTFIVRLKGDLDVDNAEALFQAFQSLWGRDDIVTVHADISAVSSLDTSAAAILLHFMRECHRRGRAFQFIGDNSRFDRYARHFDLEAFLKAEWAYRPDPDSLPAQIGEHTLDFLKDVRHTVAFLGGVILGLLDSIRRPWKIRWSETLFFMEQSGANALPIVALIAFLIGFIMAYQSASQFQEYGADIYIADLVGLIVTRELGPVMTAIIIAGRSGGAFTAEIGTMKVSEEIDALSVMGFDVFQFLIAPKIIALNLMLPCLTILADVIGIAGGLVAALMTLDLSLVQYVNETYLAVGLADIGFGLVKSMIFGILIAGIACYRGMQVSGSADSVGRNTTSSVVSSIFAIVIADAGFAVFGRLLSWV